MEESDNRVKLVNNLICCHFQQNVSVKNYLGHNHLQNFLNSSDCLTLVAKWDSRNEQVELSENIVSFLNMKNYFQIILQILIT